MSSSPSASPILPTLSFCIEQMGRRGFELAQVLAGSGLDAVSYQNPRTLVSARQELVVYRNILRISRSPTIGLELGRAVSANSIGVLGALAANAADLGHAGYLLRRFSALSSPWMASELLGELARDKLVVRYKPICNLGELYRFIVDREIRGTQALLADVFGAQAARFVSDIAFGYPEPAGARRYPAEFGCPVSFGRDATYVTFDNSLARIRNERPCAISYNLYLSLCRDALGSHAPQTWQRQVLNILSSADDYPPAAEMAAKLACSERSLRRHLKAEGYQYSELIDRVRFDRAAYLLTHSRDSVKEIGFRLRYSEPANFVHAFIRWSGVSPTRFRNAAPKSAH